MVNLKINIEELESFIVGVQSRFGIDFSGYKKNLLSDNIAKMTQSYRISSMFELWSKILKDKVFASKFIDKLLESETSFFSGVQMWKVLSNLVALHFPKTKPINTWHIGCSTGQEVYSMAILLSENCLLDNASILATDLSENALKQAELGIYANTFWSKYLSNYLAYNPKGKPLNHFITGSKIRMRTQLKKHIRYQCHNILHDNIEHQSDIIFCRNVLSYFEKDAQEKVISRLFNALNKGGILVLGHRENVPSKLADFFVPLDRKYRIYRKMA